MILLSSAAKNIFWLGRYLSRIQQACAQIPFSDDQKAVDYAQNFCLPAWDSQSLNRLFLDPEQPFSIQAQFQHIRSNILQLRAIFMPTTYAELNRLTKNTGSKADGVCQIVQDCTDILDGEVESVFLFYRLGYAVEELDHQCRLEAVQAEQLNELDQVLKLLKNYGWQGGQQSLDTLLQQTNMQTLHQFSEDLLHKFEGCE
jgi:hypothetical protein